LKETDLPFGDYFAAGAAGVCSAAGAGAGADVSAGFVSFGTMALSWQPINDKDNNLRHDAISTDMPFFTFSSSFFKLSFTHKTLEICFRIW
jgi:hypothetical protein